MYSLSDPSKLSYLNLGCGSRYDDRWYNLDFVGIEGHVIGYNLLTGIPFPDESFDVVYHSHVLEHFSKKQGIELIKECYRVLKKGGVLRIAVPDIERSVREYLKNLDGALNGDKQAQQNYDWNIIELLDQLSRHQVGGYMIEYLKAAGKENQEYIKQRIGSEAQIIWKENDNIPATPASQGLKGKIKNYLKKKDFFRFYSLGKYRLGGEIHQWMYDRYSLRNLLSSCGFVEPHQTDGVTSSIQSWQQYQLDTDANGQLRKPDSLFMEAKKI